jgi:NADH-quinone oxidoreductase subunit N
MHAVNVNIAPLLPAAQILVTALVVMMLDLFLKEKEKGLLAWISLLGLALGGIEVAFLWDSHEGAFHDSYMLDNFALFFTALFLGATALTVLSSVHYIKDTGIHRGEFYAMVLFATLGMVLMAAGNDLMVFFLGLETMSVAVYVLTGIERNSSRSAEAALKYFLTGAFATGFLLYGIALIYGATGSTNLNEIATYLVEPVSEWPAYLVGGALLLIAGFAFKIGAVPFHFWIPDVYEGAPTPVTGLMSVGVKAAAFAAWGRIVLHKLSPLDADWVFPVAVLAVATMTLGNLLALSQASVKRMLAYSSVAHAGYLLIGIAVGEEWGGMPLLFYLLTYGFMTAGAFAVLSAIGEGDTPREKYSDFAGLGFRRPFLALSMALFMLSLAGFPPLAGFTGKLYIFRAAVLSGNTVLAVIGVLNSLLSVAYYVRVIVAMYMEEGGAPAKSFGRSPCLYAAVVLALAGTLYLGLLPAQALEWSRVAFFALD